MIKKPITINLSTGLEARPVAQLVQVASQFNSEIYVEIGKKRVNAKSIMGMMTLGLDAGEEITLSANGGNLCMKYNTPWVLHKELHIFYIAKRNCCEL